MDDDFAFEEEKGEQKGGPKTSKVDQKGGPETREAILQLISENASITSREMANRLNINRSAISKHLKRMQDDNMIRREGAENGGYPPTQNGDIRSLFWLFSLMALQN